MPCPSRSRPVRCHGRGSALRHGARDSRSICGPPTWHVAEAAPGAGAVRAHRARLSIGSRSALSLVLALSRTRRLHAQTVEDRDPGGPMPRSVVPSQPAEPAPAEITPTEPRTRGPPAVDSSPPTRPPDDRAPGPPPSAPSLRRRARASTRSSRASAGGRRGHQPEPGRAGARRPARLYRARHHDFRLRPGAVRVERTSPWTSCPGRRGDEPRPLLIRRGRVRIAASGTSSASRLSARLDHARPVLRAPSHHRWRAAAST